MAYWYTGSAFFQIPQSINQSIIYHVNLFLSKVILLELSRTAFEFFPVIWVCLCEVLHALDISFNFRSRSANVILPSHLKRKRDEEKFKNKRMRSGTIQEWDHDIVCIPLTSDLIISYPRGKARTRLGALGLIGKIRISSLMSVEEVQKEIRSVFKGPMKNKPNFKFLFLQPTGVGTKTLSIPPVSNIFSWIPQQVAKSGNKQAIYILAQEELAVKLDSEVN